MDLYPVILISYLEEKTIRCPRGCCVDARISSDFLFQRFNDEESLVNELVRLEKFSEANHGAKYRNYIFQGANDCEDACPQSWVDQGYDVDGLVAQRLRLMNEEAVKAAAEKQRLEKEEKDRKEQELRIKKERDEREMYLRLKEKFEYTNKQE